MIIKKVRKVRIVRSLKKPCIKFIKKRSANTIKLVINNKTKQEPFNNVINSNLLYNHYIGLIFIQSNYINHIKKPPPDDLHNNTNIYLQNKKPTVKDTKYLHITNILLKNRLEFEIIKLTEDVISNNFKYKRYIYNYIKKTYFIKKHDIINIKLYETVQNLHNYIIILSNTTCINNGLNWDVVLPNNTKYIWKRYFDFYKYNGKPQPKNKDIYKFIIEYKLQYSGFKSISDYVFNPEKTRYKCPEYIVNYRIPYYNLLLYLST